jgi:hypothetical protein
MKTIRAGSAGSTEIIVVTNELEPSSISFGSNQSGDGLRVMRVRGSSTNLGRSWLRAYGKLSGMNITPQSVTIDVSGSSSVVQSGKIPTIDTIIKMVNLIMQGDDTFTISDVIKLVNAALTDTPMDMMHGDTDNMQSQLAYPVWYAVRGGTRYGVSRSFADPSFVGLNDFFPSSVTARQPGCINDVNGGNKWTIKCLDMIRWNDHIFVAVGAVYGPSSGGNSNDTCAVMVYDVDIKRGSPMALIGGVYDVYRYLFPSNYSRSGTRTASLIDVSLAVVDGVIYVGVLGQLQQGTNDERFANIFSLPVALYPVLCKSSQFQVGSDGVITFTVDVPIFKNVISGDEVCITRGALSSYQSATGVFVVQSRLSDYSVTLVAKDKSGTFFGGSSATPRETLTSANSSSFSCYVAISKMLNPSRPRGHARRSELFAGCPNVIDIADNQSGGLIIAHDSRETFNIFGYSNTRTYTYVLQANDHDSIGRKIRFVLPPTYSGVEDISGLGKAIYLKKISGLSLPGVLPGSSIRILSGISNAPKTFMIQSRYQYGDSANENKSYYVIGNTSDLDATSNAVFSQYVEVEVEVPVANALSGHVAANIDLKNGETITAMHVPFTWSAYPIKSEKVIYVGTNMGRIFRTIDGGASWDEIYSPLYGQNNRAGKNFPVLSIFCFHMDDPRDITFSSIQRVGAAGSRQYKLSVSGTGKIYWWPYQAFELRIGSARLVCVRSELIKGKSGTFQISNGSQEFDFIVSNESDTTVLDGYVGQTNKTFTFVPLPDVIATSRNGIVVRAHHYDLKNGFMVLSAPAQSGSNPAVPADFNVEDKDPDYGQKVMLDTSVDLIDQSWDVLGPIGSGNAPMTNNGGVYNSTQIAGCIVESGGTVRYVTGGSTHVSWPRLNFTNSNNEPISSVSVCRAVYGSSDSSNKVMIIFGGGGKFSGYVGTNQTTINVSWNYVGIGAIGSTVSVKDTVATNNVNLSSAVSETVPGLNAGSTITATGGLYIAEVNENSTNVQYGMAFFMADSQGNVYACSPMVSNFEAQALKFNYVTSVPGSINAIDVSFDDANGTLKTNLFLAGVARDGTPTVWLLTWTGNDPINAWPYAVRQIDNNNIKEAARSPKDVIQAALPDVPKEIVASPRILVAGQNHLMIARQGIFSGVQLSKPCLLSLSGGSLLLAVVNETGRAIDIYSASAPGLVFSLISSYKPSKTSFASWADAPRPRLMETEFGEIILFFDNDIRVSVDGGRSWHTGLSDKIPLPVSFSKPSDQHATDPAAVLAPVFGTVGYLYKKNTSTDAAFRFARSMTDSAADAVGCPAIPNKELLVGLKNLVISFSGEPQGGDRFSIDLDYANGASLLGAKSPSVALEVDISSSDAELVWDRMSQKYDSNRKIWNVDAIGLFGINFSKAEIKLSKASDLGSNPTFYSATLHSFVMPDGSFADGYSDGYSISGCKAFADMIYVPSATLNHGVFRPGRRQYYVVVITSGPNSQTYVAKILDNTKNTLVVEYGSNPNFSSATNVQIKIFSDRMFSVLKNVEGHDYTKDVDGDYPYRYCRFVRVRVPSVATSGQYVYGSKARIGVVAHGVATPYGNLTYRGESKHKFSRGFSYRERHFRTVRETETGQVSVVELSSKPRLELTLEYDDALWEDRDMTMASMLPALKKPVILVLDSNDPQSAEWMELAEEPVVKNTFADRYTWEVTWREVV